MALPIAGLAACGTEQEPSESSLNVGTSISGACPTAGSCGALPRFDLSTIANTSLAFPATMAPGEKIVGVPVMENTGPGTWDSTDIRFHSQMSPRSFWGTVTSPVVPTIGVGQTSAHNILMRAPTAAGPYNFRYGMRNVVLGFNFGTAFNTSITVVPGQTRVWSCQHVSDTVPRTMGAGQSVNAQLRVRNNGLGTWNLPGTTLCQMDSKQWGALDCVPPSAGAPATVAPTEEVEYTWKVTAPTTPGTYTLRRQLKDTASNGVGLFDDDAADSCVDFQITVQLCGSGILGDDPTEECDDGNLDSGDGCSSTCTLENVRVVDLSSGAGDRSISGRTENKGLGNVITGDFIGSDSIPDVCVGDIDTVLPPAPLAARTTAGRVTCYTGTNFYAGGDVVVPTGAGLEIIGATAGDRMGGSAPGRIIFSDISGDGRADLLASAPLGDGPVEGRTDAGEVYFIPGSSSLAGQIDLANPPVGVVRARIFGRAAGDTLRVLAVGELTGDGVRDVVVGAPGSDQAGVDAGAAYIISGALLMAGGDIDLAVTAPVATFLGAAAGELFGSMAAIGDIDADSVFDLVLGNSQHSSAGRTKNGAVWAYLGPIAGGSFSVGTDWDLRVIGATSNDNLGRAVTIGEFRGDGPHWRDLIIGVPQARRGGVQVGSVDVFQGPIAIPPGDATIDMLTDSPDTRLWGSNFGDQTGSALRLGDFDGDFYLDLAVSASSADGPTEALDGAGEVTVVLGHPFQPAEIELSATHPLKVFGRASRDLMGAHPDNLSFVDFDGDRRADLCIGSYRGNSLRQGRVDCFAQ